MLIMLFIIIKEKVLCEYYWVLKFGGILLIYDIVIVNELYVIYVVKLLFVVINVNVLL